MTQFDLKTSNYSNYPEPTSKFVRERIKRMSFTINQKNRVVETQLKEELNRISKQAKNDLKMYRNEQQRFKNKYSKYDVFNEKRGSDPSDVRMYETHIPGFCYRKDGASRIPNQVATNQSVDFQDLHDMLFTKSEIDIEKLVCLHLLSAHKTDLLEAPPKSYKLYLSREQAPLERLIERSKKRAPTPVRITRLLPTYVLDVDIENNAELKDLVSKNPVNDYRLSGRLIMNDKIVELCDTVMNALRKSNGKKMSELVELSRSPEKLKKIVNKHDLQEFLRRLSGLNLISSCESFHLVPTMKLAVIPLKFSTSTGLLEKLVLQIRKNIFQVPSVDSWSLALSESFSMYENIEEKRAPTESYVKPKVDQVLGRIPERKPVASEKTDTEKVNTTEEKEDRVSITNSKRRSLKYEEEDLEFDSYIKKMTKTLNRSPLREMQIDEKKAKPIPEVEEEPVMTYNINNQVNEAILGESKSEVAKATVESSASDKVEEATGITDHSTHTTAHSNCKACSEKWKQATVTPKAATVRRSSTIPVFNEAMAIEKTDSMHRLSGLVDRNKNKLQYYEQRFSRDRENRQSLNKMRSSMSSQGSSRRSSVEIVELDKLDLAKIRQEIKENETKKKLDKFIENQQLINRSSISKNQ